MQNVNQTTIDRLIEPSDPYEMIFAACELGAPSCITLDWVLNAIERNAHNEDLP